MRQAMQLRKVGDLKKKELRRDREAHNTGALETRSGEGQSGLSGGHVNTYTWKIPGCEKVTGGNSQVKNNQINKIQPNKES